jgi:predicted nucleotidyltransferase
MKPEILLASLKKEFKFICSEVEGILLYGSYAKSTADKRSDIDICIIKPRKREVLTRIFAKVGGRYDVKIFEDLPLYVQIDIIENYRVIYGNEPDISYYFYGFRKKWEDMRYRIMSNRFRSASEMAVARRKWLETTRQIRVKA